MPSKPKNSYPERDMAIRQKYSVFFEVLAPSGLQLAVGE